MSQWSVLPVELLEAINELVILYDDKVRLHSVSVAWHSPLSKLPHQKLHRSPCLLLSYDHENTTSCSLFDPLDKKFYQLDKLPKPAQGGKLFKGSFHGWLVTAQDNSPSVGLINPLTGAQLKLPPRSSFPDVVKYRSNKPDHEYAIRAAYDKTGYYTLSSTHVRKFFTYKIVMLGSPNTSDDYLAVAIYGEFDRLAYCRKGYKKWVHLAGDRKPYVDVTFFRGLLYALACNAELLICEVGKCGAPTVTEIKNPSCSPRSIGCKLYLVEHSGGLLMVERVLAPCCMGELSRTLGFAVRKFDDSCSSCDEVKDLGGDALFLGLNLSSYISSGDFPECRRNCIYFTDDNMDFSYLDGVLEAGRGFDMGIYNLDDGEIERFPVQIELPMRSKTRVLAPTNLGGSKALIEVEFPIWIVVLNLLASTKFRTSYHDFFCDIPEILTAYRHGPTDFFCDIPELDPFGCFCL